MRKIKVDELKGAAWRSNGSWVAAGFVDRGETRIVVAVGHGRNRVETLRRVMQTAIDRIESGEL